MSTLQPPIVFDEWALDITCFSSSGTLAFVPVNGNEVVWGMTVVADRSPGPLTSVVSQNNIQDVYDWVADHPSWQIDYGNADDLREATLTSGPGEQSLLSPLLDAWHARRNELPVTGIAAVLRALATEIMEHHPRATARDVVNLLLQAAVAADPLPPSSES